MLDNRVVVQIGTYNANLQGHKGLPQNLVDWLAPSLTVSTFLSNMRTAPDIVAIGFQELLPLQLGLAGLSKPVMRSRDELIRSQLEMHAPQHERYVLVAKAVNVGISLLVYARDDTVATRIVDVQTQWTGCGPGWMGNKGAVGARFRIAALDGGPGEVYTFVNAHLTPHQHKLERRLADYKHIVQTLLFRPTSTPMTREYSNIYHTTHLFFFGDLNFRVDPPSGMTRDQFEAKIRTEHGREELQYFDQLSIARAAGKALTGLREGDFWKFQCTYKYVLGQVDEYHIKRTPAWTDRILFTTDSDDPSKLLESSIVPLVYTPIPSYIASDHKPVMALLRLPPPPTGAGLVRLLSQPAQFSNDPYWIWKRYTGKVLGWTVGWVWCLFWFVGAGNAVVGICGSLLGMMGVVWWNNPNVNV